MSNDGMSRRMSERVNECIKSKRNLQTTTTFPFGCKYCCFVFIYYPDLCVCVDRQHPHTSQNRHVWKDHHNANWKVCKVCCTKYKGICKIKICERTTHREYGIETDCQGLADERTDGRNEEIIMLWIMYQQFILQLLLSPPLLRRYKSPPSIEI